MESTSEIQYSMTAKILAYNAILPLQNESMILKDFSASKTMHCFQIKFVSCSSLVFIIEYASINNSKLPRNFLVIKISKVM